MTITTTAPALSAAGISAPSYADVLDYLKTQYRSIYGGDVYLESDSQDGQFLAIVAKAISDSNAAAIAVYNQFAPQTAVGTGLSANVKLVGLTRQVPTYSTVGLTITGTAGTTVRNGIVQDTSGNKWALPAAVVIPAGGQVSAIATCTAAGAVVALPGSVKSILTPQLGWTSATNPAAAITGAPVESDAALRQRQAVSTSGNAQSPLASVVAAVAAVPGVTRFAGYENPNGAPDANGLPAHSIALVVEGGAPAVVAAAIANKKTVGAASYGTTTQTVADAYGITRPISFFVVAEQRVTVALTLRAINGYSAAVGAKVAAALAAYVNSLAIGQAVFATRLFGPAGLLGDPDGLSYEIASLGVALYPNVPALVDVPIAFNQAAHLDPSDVVITVI